MTDETTYATRLPDFTGPYIAPDPSPEQIANGKAKCYDYYDRLGSKVLGIDLNLSASDTLAAAGTLHDILYVKGGTQAELLMANLNFRRDCRLLALACDDDFEVVDFELTKGRLFSDIVDLIGYQYWQSVDRNTPVTWSQEMANGVLAQRFINYCARSNGFQAPYGSADFGNYCGE